MLLVIFLLLNSVAGSKAKMEGFVVKGEYADIEEFPHSAFLVIECHKNGDNKLVWICGSSLINQRVLLTAAHCLHTCLPGSKTTANIGNVNRDKGHQTTGSGFVVHEKYNMLSNDCDIALLKLKRPAPFSDKIKRVAIMKNPPYEEHAYLAGWGLINEYNPQGALLLRKLDQKVWKREGCSQTIGYVPKGTICASSKSMDTFASQGDSGSALIVRGYIQIGIVSFKTPRLGTNVVVYTDVGYYYDWIVHNVYNLYCFHSTG